MKARKLIPRRELPLPDNHVEIFSETLLKFGDRIYGQMSNKKWRHCDIVNGYNGRKVSSFADNTLRFSTPRT